MPTQIPHLFVFCVNFFYEYILILNDIRKQSLFFVITKKNGKSQANRSRVHRLPCVISSLHREANHVYGRTCREGSVTVRKSAGCGGTPRRNSQIPPAPSIHVGASRACVHARRACARPRRVRRDAVVALPRRYVVP